MCSRNTWHDRQTFIGEKEMLVLFEPMVSWVLPSCRSKSHVIWTNPAQTEILSLQLETRNLGVCCESTEESE